MTDSLELDLLGGPLLSKDTLAEQAYRRLREAVTDGTLSPGRMISEPKLSSVLEISRAAIREALVRLEAEGYVRRTGSGRWHVTEVTRGGVRETYECRGVLEGFAAFLAANRATTDELEGMRSELESFRSACEAGRLGAAALHSTRFHDLVIKAAHNTKLVDLMNMLRPQLLINRRLILEHETREPSFVDENEHLLYLIECGDTAEAEQWARDSARHDLAAVLRLFDRGIINEEEKK